jgi:hypothetical protein
MSDMQNKPFLTFWALQGTWVTAQMQPYACMTWYGKLLQKRYGKTMGAAAAQPNWINTGCTAGLQRLVICGQEVMDCVLHMASTLLHVQNQIQR